MTDLFNRLNGEISVFDAETTVYDLAQVRALATRCIDLGGGALLAVQVGDGYADHVSFVVMEFSYGPAPRQADGGGEKLGLVFHGDGWSGGLRELRHSYWGDGGYLFHVSGKVVVSALVALQEWFDLGLAP